VKPIYDEIITLEDNDSTAAGHSCVRYLPISEVPNQYSIGIFVFAPHARMPLHDHPGMCVLSRVLYGDLKRLSLDLARNPPSDASMTSVPSPTPHDDDEDEDDDDDEDSDHHHHQQQQQQQPHGYRRNGGTNRLSWFTDSHSSDRHKNQTWLESLFFQSSAAPAATNQNGNSVHDVPKNLPKGSKLAYKNKIDRLEAPDVTMLYPYEGNLHEFVAGPYGAAVLDVLLPPYDNEHERDCTFYTIHDITRGRKCTKEPCYIIPTGHPENFHCNSGKYRDIGGTE